MGKRVIVIGGGLAGLAAAQRLAERGFSVTILESRNRLGGRAGSFVDPTTGQVIDACQHVSMGCCTELAKFFQTMGVAHLLQTERTLYFQTPDGRVTRFQADPLPAPFHLARSFWRLHYLTWTDRLRIAWGLACLRFSRCRDESPYEATPFLPWLLRKWQSPRTIERFWAIVLVSALNESVERMGFKYARKVFVDGFLRDRRGFEVAIPTVSLDRLYGQEMRNWFQKKQVEIRLNSGVQSIRVNDHQAVGVTMRDGEHLSADWLVAAVPSQRLLGLLPNEITDDADFSGLKFLEYSPIVSVHLWFDRPVMTLPHVVLVDCMSQWIFSHGEVAPGEWYIQVVISAARELAPLRHTEIEQRVVAELEKLLPDTVRAQRIRCRVVTEHAATFSPIPGVDYWRPGPVSPIERLVLAGDWTATGWPATMEGAVRSGYEAANIIPNS